MIIRIIDVGLVDQTYAPDPPLQDPEVAPGEATNRASLQFWLCSTCGNKDPRVPRPGHLQPKTRMETLAKVFWVNLPANVKKRPFSATDRCTSPEPEFSALPHRHHRMQRGRADQVLAPWQVISARAQTVLASKGPMERLPRLSQSFIKLFNH